MMLSEFVSDWESRISSTHSKATVSSYHKDVRRFISWLGEDLSDGIDASALEDFDDHLKEIGLSISSRQRSFYAISNLFSFLKRRGFSVSGSVSPSRPRGTTPRRKAIPSQVMEGIISGEKDVMYQAFFAILSGTGARIGEALALDVSDVDLGEMTIEISGSKGSGSRMIPLPSRTVDILDSYIKNHRRDAKIGSPLFVTRVGSRMSEKSARKAWKKALIRVGNDGEFCMHQVRHRYGTDVVERGGLDVGQALLGHRSPSSTMRYSHPSIERMRDAVA